MSSANLVEVLVCYTKMVNIVCNTCQTSLLNKWVRSENYFCALTRASLWWHRCAPDDVIYIITCGFSPYHWAVAVSKPQLLLLSESYQLMVVSYLFSCQSPLDEPVVLTDEVIFPLTVSLDKLPVSTLKVKVRKKICLISFYGDVVWHLTIFMQLDCSPPEFGTFGKMFIHVRNI